jgi:microcompartment protein CcmK/EutM
VTSDRAPARGPHAVTGCGRGAVRVAGEPQPERQEVAMELGKVRGQVVSTVRDAGLPNMTFLLVDIVDEKGNVTFPSQVAADSIGAGEGELVLLVRGSSARLIREGKTPLDLSVIGIVDQITSGKEAVYTK